MNRRGFTLIEVLLAGSLLLIALAGFNYLLKLSLRQVEIAQGRAAALYDSRGLMEATRRTPFAQLISLAPSGVTVTPLAEDICLVRAGGLYTLRSRYE